MPISLVGKLVSIGTLLAFLLVCVGVPILRRLNPHAPRPFRVPAPWVVGLSGAAACLWLMSGLDLATWLRLGLWLVLGLGIYFTYGRRNSLLQRERGRLYGPARVDVMGFGLYILASAGLVWYLYGFRLGATLQGLSIHLLGASLCAVLAGCGLRMILRNRALP